MEWLYSTCEGRSELQKLAGYERLLVVTLHRVHEYINLDNVKAELSSKVLELAPLNVGKQVIKLDLAFAALLLELLAIIESL